MKYAILIILAALLLAGCKTGTPEWITQAIGGSPDPTRAPAPPNHGAAQSWDTLKWMSGTAFIVGLLITVASYVPVLPLSPMRKMGHAALGIGFVAALLPWVGEYFLEAIRLPFIIAVWSLLASGVVVVAYLGWEQWSVRRRIRKVEKLEATAPPQERAKHQGAIAAMQRVIDPKIDKEFKEGTRQVAA